MQHTEKTTEKTTEELKSELKSFLDKHPRYLIMQQSIDAKLNKCKTDLERMHTSFNMMLEKAVELKKAILSPYGKNDKKESIVLSFKNKNLKE